MSSIWDILNISTLKYLVSLSSQISRLFSAIKVWGKISDNTALVTSEISEELTETNGSQKRIFKKEATPPPKEQKTKLETSVRLIGTGAFLFGFCMFSLFISDHRCDGLLYI